MRQPLAAHDADGTRQPLDTIPFWGPHPSSQGLRSTLRPHSEAAPVAARVVPGSASASSIEQPTIVVAAIEHPTIVVAPKPTKTWVRKMWWPKHLLPKPIKAPPPKRLKPQPPKAPPPKRQALLAPTCGARRGRRRRKARGAATQQSKDNAPVAQRPRHRDAARHCKTKAGSGHDAQMSKVPRAYALENWYS
jgi:hypothetical protein